MEEEDNEGKQKKISMKRRKVIEKEVNEENKNESRKIKKMKV